MSIPHYSGSREREGKRVVLLVEDERFVREATCRILQSADFEVLTAADAQEALRVYEDNKERVDLLMTDLVLPGGDGQRLGADIRRRAGRIPVLLTSGYLCGDGPEESGNDCTFYLAKPYSRSELVEKITQVLGMTARAVRVG